MPRKNISIREDKDGKFYLYDEDLKEVMDCPDFDTKAAALAERREYWRDIAELERDEASEARGLAMMGGYWEG